MYIQNFKPLASYRPVWKPQRQVCSRRSSCFSEVCECIFRAEPYITASDSLGCISLIKVGSSERLLDTQRTWQAHDFEAWITAFNQWDPNIVFTGLYPNCFVIISPAKCVCGGRGGSGILFSHCQSVSPRRFGFSIS